MNSSTPLLAPIASNPSTPIASDGIPERLLPCCPAIERIASVERIHAEWGLSLANCDRFLRVLSWNDVDTFHRSLNGAGFEYDMDFNIFLPKFFRGSVFISSEEGLVGELDARFDALFTTEQLKSLLFLLQAIDINYPCLRPEDRSWYSDSIRLQVTAPTYILPERVRTAFWRAQELYDEVWVG